jgi:hypothetical protein
MSDPSLLRPEDCALLVVDLQAADLHIASQVQVFVQVQSDFAPWKTMLSPVDTDRLDLEQAFIARTEPVADGTLKLRLGRQQFAFDLWRFVSVRDGPNVRQSYDAGWGDYENGPWRLITFYSHPVQVQDNQVFDDYSSSKQTFGGARLERKLTDTINLAGYYANFTQADVHFPNAAGKEDQDILDLRLNGTVNHFDWDLEAMNQTARIGSDQIEAWAFGSPAGYTFNTVNWSPRLGIQLDAASGDGGVAGHHFGTFNPLFPNGYYLTLAVHGIRQLHPHQAVADAALVSIGEGDARGSSAVAREHGRRRLHPAERACREHGRWPRRLHRQLRQLRVDWTIDRATAFAVEPAFCNRRCAAQRRGG